MIPSDKSDESMIELPEGFNISAESPEKLASIPEELRRAWRESMALALALATLFAIGLPILTQLFEPDLAPAPFFNAQSFSALVSGRPFSAVWLLGVSTAVWWGAVIGVVVFCLSLCFPLIDNTGGETPIKCGRKFFKSVLGGEFAPPVNAWMLLSTWGRRQFEDYREFGSSWENYINVVRMEAHGAREGSPPNLSLHAVEEVLAKDDLTKIKVVLASASSFRCEREYLVCQVAGRWYFIDGSPSRRSP